MRLAEYESIRAHLPSLPCARYPDMDALKAAHPGVSLDTLVSICAQESSRRIKAHHGRHARAISDHARRYLAGEDIFDVAHDADFPPCQLMRLLVEHVLGVGHKAAGALVAIREAGSRRTHRRNLRGRASRGRPRGRRRAVRADPVRRRAMRGVGPRRVARRRRVEALRRPRVRRSARGKTERDGVPFVSEGSLRAEGHAKTPDVKLELPIAVRGRVVNWIDSKASFCDPIVHYERGAEQFQGYVDRFGPGMVVYWLGVVDEIAEESELRGDVLVVDDFPDESEVTKLKLTPRV